MGDFDLSQTQIQIKDKIVVSQLFKVLRAKIGDPINLCDGKGLEARIEITTITRSNVEVEIIEVYENKNEPKNQVTLYCSILKRTNFELVIQKATEIGIKKIVPLICNRTITLKTKEERLKNIIREASEQSGRGTLPVLETPVRFKGAFEIAKENDLNLLFHIDPESLPLASILPNMNCSLGVFIGPEGGWDDDEVTFAVGNNLKVASLGKLTLRAETAAIVASYLATQSHFVAK